VIHIVPEGNPQHGQHVGRLLGPPAPDASTDVDSADQMAWPIWRSSGILGSASASLIALGLTRRQSAPDVRGMGDAGVRRQAYRVRRVRASDS